MEAKSKKNTSDNSDLKGKKVMKKCFIVTPIGEAGSEIRKNTDGIINVILRPILVEAGYECHAAHELLDPGSISNQIIQKLMQDDLVIAVLTGLNPNVMYELAVRHSVGKPVISLAEEGTKIPFDITTDRVVFYENSIIGVGNLKAILKQTIEKIDNEAEPDNPVYRAAQGAKIMKDIQVGDIDNFILESLNSINGKLNSILKNPGTIYKPLRVSGFKSFIVQDKNGETNIDVIRELLQKANMNKYIIDISEYGATGKVKVAYTFMPESQVTYLSEFFELLGYEIIWGF